MTTLIKRDSSGTIWKRGVKAAAIAIIINLCLYWLSAAFHWIPASVLISPADVPLTEALVIFASLIGIGLGTLVYQLLVLFTTKAKFIFAILGGFVLLLSFISPFSIADAPVSMIIMLNIMHVVAGVSSIWFLIKK
ncbi:DUF6069 family protein [Paenibacillus roseipurpureus]|uniref:DUF6069 family protein n=1 Tax=Paenibacillus roseopurpureus TaxID=2918901 RepID=A0AA96LQE0_9BACL|nr:DUF6069 family protein [Paenibacillus sp. MBLB1832]WNR45402.1 DUF6069 family protein [Paenibacillus sp. MBLB1832]